MMKIKINNWDKYQQRTSGYRKCWWFSMSNTFLRDSEMWSLTDAEKIAWVYLLCEASSHNNDEIVINFDHATRSSNIKESDLRSLIKKGQSFHWIAIICTDLDLNPSRIRPIQNNTEQNNTVPKGTSDLAATESKNPLAEIWNENCGTLPKVKVLGPTRAKACLARLKQHPNLEDWVKTAKALARSPFHNGQNDRGWRADFDFFIKPTTIAKALEGSFNPGVVGASKPKITIRPVNRTQENEPNV